MRVETADQQPRTSQPPGVDHLGYTSNLQIKRAPLGTTARTSEICPESGVWKVEGTPSTTAPISKGNRMPPYDGRAVTWRLIQYA